ncbi:MAG: T9SS type A sorting domain-containing protein, partial [Ignavibacteria bacterium]|nr:T9SS type A sorting domain-containing protein [Ignavibacteria bacterium]
QNVSTVNGTYLAKKFLITATLSYLLTIPPFPTVAIPIVTRPDTVYIASGIWTIKDIIPSVNVDLSAIGFPFSFSIPGNVRELTSPSVGITGSINSVPAEYSLSQNYPNPFNPSTMINFSVPQTGKITIKIYNLLGTEIKTLVSGIKQKGSYEVEFNASDLSSGIYYCRMQSDNFSDTKQMMLLK